MLMPEALPSTKIDRVFRRQASSTECTHHRTVPSPVSGMARLQQLASFGRYGADTQKQRQCAAMHTPRPAVSRPSSLSQLTASLNEFYGWVAQQAGHTIASQSTTRTPPAPVKRQEPLAKQVVRFQPDTEQKAAVSHTGKKGVTNGAREKAGKSSRRKQRGDTQHVVLPSVFTMQGISINTTCLQALSYYNSDGKRVQSLTPPPSSLGQADLYIDATSPMQHSPAPHGRATSPASAAGTPTLSPQQHASLSSTLLPEKGAERTLNVLPWQHAASSSTSLSENGAEQHTSMQTKPCPLEQVASTSYDSTMQPLQNRQLQQNLCHATLKKKARSSSPDSTGSSQSGATVFHKSRGTDSCSSNSDRHRGTSNQDCRHSDRHCGISDTGCSNTAKDHVRSSKECSSCGRSCSYFNGDHVSSGRHCSIGGTGCSSNDGDCSNNQRDDSPTGRICTISCREHGNSISDRDCINNARDHSNNDRGGKNGNREGSSTANDRGGKNGDREGSSTGTVCRNGGADHSKSGKSSSGNDVWPTTRSHAAYANSLRGALSATHSHTLSVERTVHEPQTHCHTQLRMSAGAQSPHPAAQLQGSLYLVNAESAISDEHVMAGSAQQSSTGRHPLDESPLADSHSMQVCMPGMERDGDANNTVTAHGTDSTRRRMSRTRPHKLAQHSSSSKTKQQLCTAQSGVHLASSTGKHRMLKSTRRQLSDVTNFSGAVLEGQGLAYIDAGQAHSQSNHTTHRSSADLYV